MALPLNLCLAVVASALFSGFQHGYNTGVINAPQAKIEQWLNQTYYSKPENVTTKDYEEDLKIKVNLLWAIAVSIYAVGGMIGGVISGFVADRFGRKGGMLLNNLPAIAGAIFEATAKEAHSPEMLLIGRLLIGVNSGLNAGLAPMYLAEISPVSLRGSIGTVYQLVITLTILLAQVLGMQKVLGTAELWPWLFALCVIPAVLQCALLGPFCPESPKYLLLNKGQEVEAHRALSWLRGTSNVQDEMEEMRQEAEKNKISKKVTLREMFGNSALRYPVIIAIMVMLSQQLSGINAVMFYSTSIFRSAKLSVEGSQYSTIGMGAMNVLMTVVSLVLVEKAGRKTLLLVGFVGMFFASILLTVALKFSETSIEGKMQTAEVSEANWVSYVAIVLVILFVVMFATGPGSIPWFLVTELFNQSARPAATAIAVTVNWTANFFVGFGFPLIEDAIKGYVFLIFAALQILFTLFIYYKVPETKNKTVEEITSMFKQTL